MKFVLRDYQNAAVEGARAELRKGVKRLIISDPTGSGKTVTAMAIIEAAIDKGSRVSFIADRRSLVKQTSMRFTEAGIAHGILMGQDSVGVRMPTRVESAQTIQSRGLRDGTDLFVIDEAHELRPEIIRQIAESGATLIGLTATPFPAKLADPIDAHLPKDEQSKDAPPRYEAMVASVTTEKLIADGWLCPFDVVAPESVIDVEGVKVEGGEFQKKELKKRILRIVGDIVPTWQEQVDKRYGGEVQPTIAFGASIDDAEAIAAEFRKAGHPARIVSSREDDDHNLKTIKAFRNGEFDVIVNCAVLSRGADFPRAAMLIDAYPMRGMLTPIQRYGRTMRMFEGKDRAIVFDFSENWLTMRDRILSFYSGGPEWPPPDFAHMAIRKKKPERDAICKACRTVIPPGESACPGCGKEKPVRKFGGTGSKLEKVDGTLKLVDSVTGATAQYGGNLWPEICTESARQCPHNRKLAYRRALASFRSITGRWPPSRKLKLLDRPSDPAVVDLMRRNFQAWLLARRAREAKHGHLR